MFKRFWCFINCKINKILSLLAIMIFVFAASCSSARVLTDIELKNFILNSYREMQNSLPTQTMINNVLNKDWSNWLNLMATHEGHYGLYMERNTYNVYLYYITGSESNLRDYNPYVYRTSDYATQVSRNSTRYYSYNVWANDFTNNVNGSGWFIKCKSDYFYYTDCNIKLNSSNQGANGSNYLVAGSYNIGAFDENYLSSTKWELVPNSNNTITIPNMPYNYYTLNKGTFTTSLATLQDSSYTNNILMSIYAYNGNSWQNVNTQYLFDEAKELISNKFPSTTTGDIMSSLIQVNSNIIPANCIISLTASPNPRIAQDLGLTELNQYFYITNSKTVITANSLDIIATFSGDTDYSNEVQQAIDNNQNDINNNNIQEIVGSLTDDSDKNNIFDNYLGGSSGDIANRLGFLNINNPFVDFFDTISLGVKDTLLGSGNVTLDLSTTYFPFVLNSNDFIIPNMALRVFVAVVIDFFLIWCIYALFFVKVYEIITGDLTPVISFLRGNATNIIKYM